MLDSDGKTTENGVVEHVLKQGSIELDDRGQRLIRCPVYETSVCALNPTEDTETGAIVEICTGPILPGQRCSSKDCRYSPE